MKIQYNIKGHCYEKGYEALTSKGVAIIGISPGNSYFKAPMIHNLINTAMPLFSKLFIFIPDKPSEHTYKALGYNEQKSQQNARQKGNTLRNHCKKSIRQGAEKFPEADIRILDWVNDVESSAFYHEQLRHINQLYQTNNEFCKDLHQETKQVIEGYIHAKQVATPESLQEGAQYLLKELAFFAAASQIIGSESITLIYHRPWPVFEKFFAGHYDGIAKNIGLLLIS